MRTERSRCGTAFVPTEGRNGRLCLVCRVPRSRRGRARAEARRRVVGPWPNALTSFHKRVFCIAINRIRVATDRFVVNGAAVPDGEGRTERSRFAEADAQSHGRERDRSHGGRFPAMAMNPSRSKNSRHFAALSAHPVAAGKRWCGRQRGRFGGHAVTKPGQIDLQGNRWASWSSRPRASGAISLFEHAMQARL